VFSSPFSEPQRQEPGSIAIAGTSSNFFIHFITGLLKALQLIYWNERSDLRVREGSKKSNKLYILLKIGEKKQSCLTSYGGRSPLPPLARIRHWERSGRDSNLWLLGCRSDALSTTPPRHTWLKQYMILLLFIIIIIIIIIMTSCCYDWTWLTYQRLQRSAAEPASNWWPIVSKLTHVKRLVSQRRMRCNIHGHTITTTNCAVYSSC